MTSAPSTELVIKRGPGRFALVLGGSVAFVAMGFWLIIADLQVPFPRALIVGVGVASIAFFGLCGVYAAYRLLSPTALLTLNANGIDDRASALGVGFIPWSTVRDVYIYTFSGQQMIGIEPHDSDRILQALPWWKRRLIAINRRMGCAPINLPQVSLSIPLTQLHEEIVRRWQTARSDA